MKKTLYEKDTKYKTNWKRTMAWKIFHMLILNFMNDVLKKI